MKTNRLQFLLKLLGNNSINEQELKELADLMEQPENGELIDAQLKSVWNEAETADELDNDLYRKVITNPRFLASLHNQNNITSRKQGNGTRLWYYVAATILLCCSMGLGIYFYTANSSNVPILAGSPHILLSEKSNKDNSHVMLTLSNGKQIRLEDTDIDKVSKENNISITKNKEGQLVYDLSRVVGANDLNYNAITTPVGSNYQVVLSDGTRVWLNAKSSIKFPAVFEGAERRVELSGEAYFEVAHNKKQPFVLSAKDMDIQVLGTHFNVSAYHDDDVVTASLLEGAIKANYKTSSLFLKPGKQALLKKGATEMSSQNFDAEEVMDWKDGYFIFRNEPIHEIMKKISRWYHIDVSYQDNLSKEAFGGKYLKSSSLKELLSSLELTGTIKFKVEGRRVTVMQ